MAKLILSMDEAVIQEYDIGKERLTIGRKPGNDIQIDNLAVSGAHAEITTILNDSFLEDLDSTNGTLVNGAPIKKHYLQNGDVVEIGRHQLKYVNADSEAGETAADFEKTLIMRAPPLAQESGAGTAASGTATLDVTPAIAAAVAAPTEAGAQPSAPVESDPQLSTPPPALALIQILTGSNTGKEIELAKSLTSLGRPGVQVAVITRRPHGYFITHVQGGDYPLVNGETLDAQPRLLHEHDVIEIAAVKMEFFFK
ncbi:MAG TPA: hypothetical protein DEP05_04440 [Betaproteobacteria bacterium]|nr:hypothetical protein [Betaproteobacteria bacterium]